MKFDEAVRVLERYGRVTWTGDDAVQGAVPGARRLYPEPEREATQGRAPGCRLLSCRMRLARRIGTTRSAGVAGREGQRAAGAGVEG